MIEQIGRFMLHVTLDGRHVKGSPSKLIVSGSCSNAAYCEIRGLGVGNRQLPDCMSGVPYSFVIEARDDFGNHRCKGGDKFVVVVRLIPPH